MYVKNNIMNIFKNIITTTLICLSLMLLISCSSSESNNSENFSNAVQEATSVELLMGEN